MTFKQKYPIIPRFLTPMTKRRSGTAIHHVRFVVLHDTGNAGSTASANVHYYENSRDEESASAHIFVDDTEILECIPALTAPPEKAWHVLYNAPKDNVLFGANANDAAIGVEYCFGGKINADESYKRYIWVVAFICYKFGLDPKTSLVGHFSLDPLRKTDPVSGLAHSNRLYEQLLRDIVSEYEDCTQTAAVPQWHLVSKAGTAHSVTKMNIRSAPNTKGPIVDVVLPGITLAYTGWVEDGESINGNPKWFVDSRKNYFWSGGVST